MTERYCRSNNLVFSRKVNDMIFVTGDIHGNGERFSSRRWRFGKGLNRNDAVIVAGDFGLPWSDSNTDTYWLDWLESKPWTTCFVDENHENHALLSKQPIKNWNNGKVHVLRQHVLHLIRGEIFNISGLTIFVMGGASSHDIQYRTAGKNWWPEELPSASEYEHARKALNATNRKVNYVIAHEAPRVIASKLCQQRNRIRNPNDPLQGFFEEISNRLYYQCWFSGHYHIDEWVNERHRLIYEDILPIGSKMPINRGFGKKQEIVRSKKESYSNETSPYARQKKGHKEPGCGRLRRFFMQSQRIPIRLDG